MAVLQNSSQMAPPTPAMSPTRSPRVVISALSPLMGANNLFESQPELQLATMVEPAGHPSFMEFHRDIPVRRTSLFVLPTCPYFSKPFLLLTLQ